LDRASFLWQRLNELEPNFRNGYVQSQLQDLNQQLQQAHLQLLRQIAESSRMQSVWGREIAAYEAILSIQRNDRDATNRLVTAKKNQEYDWLYTKAQES